MHEMSPKSIFVLDETGTFSETIAKNGGGGGTSHGSVERGSRRAAAAGLQHERGERRAEWV